jgi:peptidoglycan/LPS O-acetylase OafA/YrhL
MTQGNVIPTNPEIETSRNYRADIDGLRAIAVIPVVLYHVGIPAFSGGFIGVDVFFVISGFLITSLILPEIQSATFSLTQFYERRVRRLFPALFAVLLFSCVAAVVLLMPGDLEDFGESAAATAIFTSNFMFYTEDGYFDGPSEFMPLLHTWSLAIEEQFYLLFPLLLVFIARYLSGTFILCLIGLWAASLLISIYSVGADPSAAFFLLPGRMWELLTGAVLAIGIFSPHSNRFVNELMGGIGLMLIVYSIFAFDNQTPFPGAAALLPCLGTFLLIYSGISQQTSIAKILSLKPLVFVGLISYSLYLWHWPIIVFSRHFLLRDVAGYEVPVIIGTSLLLAILSWRFIELPFRGSHGLLSRSALFRVSGIVMFAIICVGLLFDRTGGLPQRLTPEVAKVVNPEPADYDKSCVRVYPQDVDMQNLCKINDTVTAPTFVVWGDSHAANFLHGIASASKAKNVNGISAIVHGCPPLLHVGWAKPNPKRPSCKQFNTAVFELIKANKDLKTIILAARWALHAEAHPYAKERGDAVFLSNDDLKATSVPQNHQIYNQGLLDVVRELKTLGRDVKIINSVPEIGWNVPVALGQKMRFNRPIEIETTYTEFLARQKFVTEAFKLAMNRYKFQLIAVTPYLCDSHRCRVMEAGQTLYTDSNHLSLAGLELIKPAFEQLFQE